jgi:hypothetical protein
MCISVTTVIDTCQLSNLIFKIMVLGLLHIQETVSEV